ncbi:T9SS type A sorting domain-containing protein [Dysgonomonas sp. 520]|uniref:T9SS type A sorting domain-containing protein n=1 Tax=Dysgonomonas sp. 520 TaxID=2302931 RepID=UPI0013D52896|nr:T9SS type A sorting domain-containing protein [Dysgonomonas sp. 520]NDW08653.1 T9SS C-terminal target domain-containing protein [Dysgonomonas sp. 520]
MKSKLLLLAFLVLQSVYLRAQFAGGDGSAENPYLIETAEQLNEVRNHLYQDIHFMLKNDIDLTDWIANNEDADIRKNGWLPIDTKTNDYSHYKYFNGAGHTIRGLFIYRPDASGVGLFGSIRTFSIKNLHIEDCQITASHDVGGLIGKFDPYKGAEINACSVTGTINSFGNTGLLIGYSSGSGNVSGCTTSGVIRSIIKMGNNTSAYITYGRYGGLIGSSSLDIVDCSTNCIILSDFDYIGGIVGYQRPGSVKNCYASGYLSGYNYVGGIAGENSNSSISGCISTQRAINGKQNIGRIVGSGSLLNENYALKDMLLNEEVLSGNSGGIHGGNKTITQLHDKSTYEALSWDFNTIWKIEGSKSSPYLYYQTVPAKITSELKSNKTSIEGIVSTSASADIWVRVNNKEPQKVYPNNESWQLSVSSLSGCDIIMVWSQENNGKKKNQSVYYVDYLGNGTEQSPYEIATASELDGIRHKKHHASYVLTNDIDLKKWIENHDDADVRNYGWRPIGYGYGFIGGYIDGKNFRIKNLFSSTNESWKHSGLFGMIDKDSEFTLKNLFIDDCHVVSEKGYVAAIVGSSLASNTLIENCHVSGYISGANAAGLIAWINEGNSSFRNCSVSANILGTEGAAGLVYRSDSNTEINNVHIYSTIKSNRNAAGLIAYSYSNNVTIKSSSVSSLIEGKSEVAGLALAKKSTIDNCYSSSILKGEAVYGLGGGASSFRNCYVQGSMVGKKAYGLTTGADTFTQNVSILSEIKGLDGTAYRVAAESPWFEGKNNYALQTMLVNKATVTGTQNNEHGADATLGQLKTSNFYTNTLNWDFDNIWKIDNSASLPYFKQQTAPPTLSTIPSKGVSLLNGTCPSSTNHIIIRINDNKPIFVATNGTNWSYTLSAPLQTGDAVLIYTKSNSLSNSYALTYSIENETGFGTDDDPILVRNADELNAIRTNMNAIYQLANDIDLADWINNNPNEDIRNNGWLPIGYLNDNEAILFNGKLKGKGYRITGLKINRPETDNVGLFGYVNEVDSIWFENVNIVGQDNVGTVAGIIKSGVKFCHVLGNIQANNNVGGIFGMVDVDDSFGGFASAVGCSFTGYISGNDKIGGLIGCIDMPIKSFGSSNGGHILNCQTSVIIKGNNRVGGLLGFGAAYVNHSVADAGSGTSIIGCYSTGAVYGNTYVGGICGYHGLPGSVMYEDNSIGKTYSSCYVSGNDYVGGLTGRRGFISNSIAASPLIISTNKINTGRISSEFGNSNNNYAYKDMLLNYETVVGSTNTINGQNISKENLHKKATYTNLNWEFETLWTVKEDASLPYYINQIEPPTLSTAIAPSVKTLSGTFDNIKGKAVMVQLNSGTPVSATAIDNAWSLTLNQELSINDVVLIWTEGQNKQRSYAICRLISYDKGIGTEDDPYLIRNAEELNSVRENLSANYRLANDIDLTGWIALNTDEDIRNNGWLPIGSKDNSFSGTLVGGNHTIKGLMINRPKLIYTGLFGFLNSSKIDSINIIDADVIGADATGILAGGMFKNVANVKISGKVSGLNCVGGLVGLVDSGDDSTVKIQGNTFDGNISGYEFIGGLIGAIDHKFNNNKQEGPYIIDIKNNFTNGSINGKDNIGGLVGYIENRIYYSNYLFSYKTTLSQNYSSMIIKGNDYLGGLVGYGRFDKWTNTTASLFIKDCYANGVIEGNENIGGIIGYCNGYDEPFLIEITNCYAANYLKGTSVIGGITGRNGNIKNCYAMNPSIVFSHTSPFVGRITPSANETESNFYSQDTKVFNLSNPNDIYTITAYGTEIVNSDLMKQSTYSANGWDFNSIWSIWDGYSYPYFSATGITQTTPPAITSDIQEGVLTLSGTYNGPNTVWVKINENNAIQATIDNGIWSCSLQEPLKLSDIIKIWSSVNGLEDSYSIYSIVGDNQHTSIENIFNKKAFIKVYPNPVVDVLSIEGLDNYPNAKVLIIDIKGRVLISNETAEDKFQLPVSTLSSGVYFVKIISEDNNVTVEKIIKK